MPGAAVDPLVPQLVEPAEAFEDRLALVLPALHRAVARHVGDHVRPVRQLAAFFERKVEERGERHRRELLRNEIDPVEFLADRQAVEDLTRTFAHDRRHLRHVGRRNRRSDGLPARHMLRLVHGDEPGAAATARSHDFFLLGNRLEVGERDAVGRGERFVVRVHGHDVGPARDRPIRSELAFRREMHRVFAAQPLEHRPERVGLESIGAGGIELLERGVVSLGDGFRFNGDVHGVVAPGGACAKYPRCPERCQCALTYVPIHAAAAPRYDRQRFRPRGSPSTWVPYRRSFYACCSGLVSGSVLG